MWRRVRVMTTRIKKKRSFSSSTTNGVQLQWVATLTLVSILFWALMATAAHVTLGLALLVMGPTVGIFLGWTQSRVLKSYIPSENWDKWTRYSIAGATLGWFVILVGYFLIIVID